MNSFSATLAIIFDFDDTLVPDSTSKLLQDYGMNPQKFWTKDMKDLLSSGFDPAHAYLKLLLDNIGDGKPLGRLTNKGLRKCGKTLDPLFYPGLPELFQDLKGSVKKYKDVNIEFYVVSGGLQEVIEGSKFIKKNFTGVYGCQLAGDTEDGPSLELQLLRGVQKLCLNAKRPRRGFNSHSTVFYQTEQHLHLL